MRVHEPAVSRGYVEQGVPVNVSMEGKVGDFARAAVQAAINPMLDQVNTCLDHLSERNDHSLAASRRA